MNKKKLSQTNLKSLIQIAMQKSKSGQLGEAESIYKRILKTFHNQATTFSAQDNLKDLYELIIIDFGDILQKQGKLEEAISFYREALDLNPNHAQVYNNLGNIFQQKGELNKAIEYYHQALKIKPNYALVHNNLGNAIKAQGNLDKAIECYQKALEILPSAAEIHYNLGAALNEQGKLEAAVQSFEEALEIRPDYPQAKFGVCMSQLPIIYSTDEEIQLRRTKYKQHLQSLANYYQLANPQEQAKAANDVGSLQPFYLAYQCLNDRALQKIYGEMICQLMSSRYPQSQEPIKIPTLVANEKIRVGFVSGFFSRHSTWKIPFKGWVENLDRSEFELFGYHTSSNRDLETVKATKVFDKFIQGPLSLEEWYETISQDNLHILIFVEFGMDAMAAKLGCLRLAPIQMTTWGHPDTSGLPTIDYYLSSDLMEPENAQQHYTENLVRLPNLSIYYTPLAIEAEAVYKQDIGLKNDEIMFWCCQSLYKYLPLHDDVFPRIAKELGSAKFVFIKHTSEQVTKVFQKRLSHAFEAFGLKYRDYCIFLPAMDTQRFAGTAAIADVFLDSIGWSGCNSTLEAIAHNIPVMTFAGELMRGRHTMAILKMMGIEETIAYSKEDYVKIAVRLGQDGQYRQYISQQVAENKHKLYGDLEPIRALEELLLKVVGKERISTTTAVTDTLRLAIQEHRANHLKEAEQAYHQVLSMQANHPEALYGLGMLAQQQGQLQEAEQFLSTAVLEQADSVKAWFSLGNLYQVQGKLPQAEVAYQQAINLRPDAAPIYNNLGYTFQQQGKLTEAVTCYQKTLELQPNCIEADVNLGNILHQQGQLSNEKQAYYAQSNLKLGLARKNAKDLQTAAAYYEKAIALQPELWEAHYHLAVTLQAQGLMEEAVQSYQQTLTIQPDCVDAHYNLANTFWLQGKLEAAVVYYEKALNLKHDHADACNNLGNVLLQQGKLDKAIQSYQKGLEIKPDSALLYNNLGNALQQEGKLEAAIQSYHKALEIAPDFAESNNNLANAFLEQGEVDKAVPYYEKAIEIKPDLAQAQLGLCISQLPIIYSSFEEIQQRRNNYQQHLNNLANYYQSANPQERATAAEDVGTLLPFFLAYQGLNDRDLQQNYGAMICQLMASRYPQSLQPKVLPKLAANEKIRVGLVSGYFQHHSNWRIPIKGWIENLDRSEFELFGYYTNAKQDCETVKAAKYFDKFIQGPLPIEQWCEVIGQDNLQVLIFPELGMDPTTVKLGCLRLAPIQITSWGHPNTSGLPTIDYYLSSDLMEPENAQEHYTEKLVKLPNLSINYSPLEVQPSAIEKTAIGVADNEILFWCCQSLFKYLPQHDDVFPRIAQQLDNCKFVFIKFAKSEWVTEVFRQRLSQVFEEFGLNYQDYCIFLSPLEPRKFAGVTAIADVFLDSIGWSGCNTTLEAIAHNIPVMTLPGDLMRGRHTTAVLKMMGLEEMIASSKEDYVKIAVRLGRDAKYRQHISQQVAENKHKLYGDLKTIKALEDFLLDVVQKPRRTETLAVADIMRLATHHHRTNRLDQAQHFYQQVIGQQLAQQPEYPEALYGFGMLMLQIGQFQEAEQLLGATVGVQPDFLKAWFSLGNVYQAQNKFPEAEIAYQRAITLQPNWADAHYNLGMVLQGQGKLEAAVKSYQQALNFKPNYIEAHKYLGYIFQEQGKLEAAIQAYQQALELQPDAAVYNNLGNAFKEQGQLDKAVECYQNALEIHTTLGIKPEAAQEVAQIYYNLATVLHEQVKLEAAFQYFQKALEIQPEYAPGKFGICMSHLPIIYTSVDEIQLRRNQYQQHLQYIANYYQLANLQEQSEAAEFVGSLQPFYLAYQGLNDRHLQQMYGEMICKLMSSRYPQYHQAISFPTLGKNNLGKNDKIRVGFVTGFFRDHSCWKLIKGWVENLNRSEFELFGYHTGSKQDRETVKAAKAFDKFIQGPLQLEQWAEVIAQDNLQVLIFPEFGMDSMTVKVGCLRLAPVQIGSWIHPETSGLPTIDYFLSSDLMEPPNAQEHYTENLIRLPNLSVYYTPLDIQPQAISKSEIGIADNDIMFWCCQSLFKYLPQHDDVFPRIAKELGTAKFVFIEHPTSKEVTGAFRQHLSNAFEEFGLNYQDYCIFLPPLESSKFAGVAAIADVFLDSIGWSGGNTTLEAIAYNIPVMTLPGELMRGRHTMAFLKMMGIEEMIATSKEDYVKIAVRLGQNAEYRQDISQQIANNKHKLYNDLAPVRALEEFLLNAFGKPRREDIDTVAETLRLAIQEHRVNHLVEAEQAYRQVLEVQPNHPEALYGLGMLVQQGGYLQESEELLNTAVQVQPDSVKAWFSLGNVYQVQGKLSQAEVAYQQAINLRPDAAPIYNNLGYTFQQQGKLTEAISCYQKTLEIQPNCIEASVNLGNILHQQG
jgi:protein O-GlcNAc transferase